MANYLKGTRCYLSSPIQFLQTDPDIMWREKITKFLVDLGVTVFDPVLDPKQQKLEVLEKARSENDYKTIADTVRNFVRKDLAAIDHSHFVIAYVPYKVPSVGVCHEIINANNAKKPVLLVTDKGNLVYIPMWYYGFIDLDFMFKNWDDLIKYLAAVDAGEHRSNNRWSYVYGDV